MARSGHAKLTVGIILVGTLAGVALIWSDPSNRDLIMIGVGVFLCLSFVKPEKLLLAYLVVSPGVDQLIPIFSRYSPSLGRSGPQIILRGGLTALLVFYLLTTRRNPLVFKVALPMFLLLILVTVSAFILSDGADLRQPIAFLAKLALWMFLTLVIADMVMHGKMELKWIYRCVAASLIFTLVSLVSIDQLLGASKYYTTGAYGVGEFSGLFGGHSLAISLSIGVIAVTGIAIEQRNKFVLLFLLAITGLVVIVVMRTYVRTGYATFLAGVFTMNLMLWRYRRNRDARRQRGILVVICVVTIGTIIPYSLIYTEALSERLTDFTGSGRTDLWSSAINQYIDYPLFLKLFGGGYELSFNFSKGRMFTHNGYIFILLYGGIVGLCLYLWLFVNLWRGSTWDGQRDHLPAVIAGSVIAAFMVAELVNGALFYPSATAYFGFLVGGAMGYYKIKRVRPLDNVDETRDPFYESMPTNKYKIPSIDY